VNRFRNFMAGRYGGRDALNMALIVLSLILVVIFLFIPIPYISFLAYIPLIFAVYRMFSKQISKRQTENYKYLVWLGKIKGSFRGIKKRAQDSKHYKYYNCPECKQKLRVPKGKGKISITCSKCQTKFTAKT
jgi:predicted membrane protein